MKQALQFRAAQNLAMTPQLQHSLRLLQLSALEFEQEIARALAENPFLEAEEEAQSSAEAGAESAAPETPPEPVSPEDFAGAAASTRAHGDGGETPELGALTPAPVSLRDHLIEQIRGARLSDRDRLLAGLIVEALDDDGYLRQSLDDLHGVVPGDIEIEPDELAIALRFVQSLEPAGVGARSPAECLELQLAREPEDRPGRALALDIVRGHLDALAAHDTP
ncbi:MAG: RNA polymerase factor sigma-54, partial [Burkholderiales bacterium]|nr:RNA polymerase factor sigma-54 [Burkholderiales bacterium]